MSSRRQWQIEGRGAPSTRGYISALAEYHRRRSEWVQSVVNAAEGPMGPTPAQVVAMAQQIGDGSQGPQPPTVSAIITANAAPARRAATHARAGMKRAGVPNRIFETLGISGEPSLLGIDLILGGVEQDSLERWASEGLGYIQNVPAERIEPLSKRLVERVVAGDRWESIRAIVSEELGIEGRRLDLIARDQVAKLNGRITQDLHSEAGITHFTWRTSRDGRVRASHRAVANREWSWAEGAPGVGFYGESGFPGQAGQCRCTAEPVIPQWMLAQSG